jgi:hypothetical protein
MSHLSPIWMRVWKRMETAVDFYFSELIPVNAPNKSLHLTPNRGSFIKLDWAAK